MLTDVLCKPHGDGGRYWRWNQMITNNLRVSLRAGWVHSITGFNWTVWNINTAHVTLTVIQYDMLINHHHFCSTHTVNEGNSLLVLCCQAVAVWDHTVLNFVCLFWSFTSCDCSSIVCVRITDHLLSHLVCKLCDWKNWFQWICCCRC